MDLYLVTPQGQQGGASVSDLSECDVGLDHAEHTGPVNKNLPKILRRQRKQCTEMIAHIDEHKTSSGRQLTAADAGDKLISKSERRRGTDRRSSRYSNRKSKSPSERKSHSTERWTRRKSRTRETAEELLAVKTRDDNPCRTSPTNSRLTDPSVETSCPRDVCVELTDIKSIKASELVKTTENYDNASYKAALSASPTPTAEFQEVLLSSAQMENDEHPVLLQKDHGSVDKQSPMAHVIDEKFCDKKQTPVERQSPMSHLVDQCFSEKDFVCRTDFSETSHSCVTESEKETANNEKEQEHDMHKPELEAPKNILPHKADFNGNKSDEERRCHSSNDRLSTASQYVNDFYRISDQTNPTKSSQDVIRCDREMEKEIIQLKMELATLKGDKDEVDLQYVKLEEERDSMNAICSSLAKRVDDLTRSNEILSCNYHNVSQRDLKPNFVEELFHVKKERDGFKVDIEKLHCLMNSVRLENDRMEGDILKLKNKLKHLINNESNFDRLADQELQLYAENLKWSSFSELDDCPSFGSKLADAECERLRQKNLHLANNIDKLKLEMEKLQRANDDILIRLSQRNDTPKTSAWSSLRNSGESLHASIKTGLISMNSVRTWKS